MSRIINMRGMADGRARIHWFREFANGPITTAADVRMTQLGPMTLGGKTGGIACNPEQNSVLPQDCGSEIFICLRSDDPRAVTCDKCMATPEFAVAMAPYQDPKTGA